MSTKVYRLSVATLVLVAALAMAFAGSFGNRTRKCLEDPGPGDIYMARVDALRGVEGTSPVYGLMRVEEVYPDRIMAHPARDSSASKRRAYRDLERAVADEIAYDMSRSIEIPRVDLLGLHARGIIVVAKAPGA